MPKKHHLSAPRTTGVSPKNAKTIARNKHPRQGDDSLHKQLEEENQKHWNRQIAKLEKDLRARNAEGFFASEEFEKMMFHSVQEMIEAMKPHVPELGFGKEQNAKITRNFSSLLVTYLRLYSAFQAIVPAGDHLQIASGSNIGQDKSALDKAVNWAFNQLSEIGAATSSQVVQQASDLVGTIFPTVGSAVIGALVAEATKKSPSVGAVTAALATNLVTAEGRIVSEAPPRVVAKGSSTEEMFHGYSESELIIPIEKFFVASRMNGDFVLTCEGIVSLADFVESEGGNIRVVNTPHVPISSESMRLFLNRNDEKGFKNLICESAKELAGNMKRYEMRNNRDVIENFKEDWAVDDYSKWILGYGDKDKVKLISQRFFQEAQKSDYNPDGYEFCRMLFSEVADDFYKKFTTEENLNRLFSSFKGMGLKYNPQVADMVAQFQNVVSESAEQETYSHRIGSLARFIRDPHSSVVLVADDVNLGNIVSGLKAGGVTSEPQSTIYCNSRSFRLVYHEVTHYSDKIRCFSNREPCDYETRTPLVTKLIEALEFDDKNIRRSLAIQRREITVSDSEKFTPVEQYELDQLNKWSLRSDDRYMGFEVIPYLTDTVSSKTLLRLFPAVSVLRAKTLAPEDSVETEFYKAILGCDKTKVGQMIKENPEIVNKSYDLMPFTEIAQILVDCGYDAKIAPSLKRDSNAKYGEINSLIYEACQPSSDKIEQVSVISMKSKNRDNTQEL